MHSHHSHSGQFCQHAKNTLEEMIQAAISRGFRQYCLTEHMPRLSESHLYPEEIESQTSIEGLKTTFANYVTEATRLKNKYKDQILLTIGCECEGISPAYIDFTQSLVKEHDLKMVVGSLHHVNEIPIDFTQEMWNDACAHAGGIEELYCRYFDQQYEVIANHKPAVIGHFDLIRLFSPSFDLKDSKAWAKAVRNVQQGVKNGSLFELNSAAIRKGWSSPYPQADIVELILSHGGKFCLSDDAHNVDQVGLNYHKVAEFMKRVGIEHVYSVHGDKVSLAEFEAWNAKS